MWVDIAACDAEAEHVLCERFGAHRLAVRDCGERSHVPKVRSYAHHVFIVVHSPLPDTEGEVHLVELDLFVGHDHLITVHGPLGENVPAEVAHRETGTVLRRLQSGQIRVGHPAELAHAILAAIADVMETVVGAIATRVAELDRDVLHDRLRDPQHTLERLFRLRHELLSLRTMAAEARDVLERMIRLADFLPPDAQPFIADIVDRFDRVRGLCDGEREFLQGVLDFHESRTATKMNVAMERLALITALALPLTAFSGIYGMNIIVNDETDFAQVLIVLATMVALVAVMLRYACRSGWW